MQAGCALRLAGICKAFDGVSALEGASLSVDRGEVHALLGENGAGKSTLMNVACGLYSADAGSVHVAGQPAAIHATSDAIRLGLGMVHQHFKLVGPFSVAENMLLACGARLRTGSLTEVGRLTTQAAEQLGFAIDPQARTDTLSIAERQRLEIVKLVLLGADILLLDEPTAVLTDTEADAVLSLLRKMAAQGKTVVLVTHRLREVSDYADRVTIMRGGRTVLGGAKASALGPGELATLMVGEEVVDAKPPPLTADTPVRLELSGLSVDRDDGTRAVEGVDLQVRGGQILGVAGVGGNGQTELAEAIFGLRRMSAGSITVDGTPLQDASVRARRKSGMRLIPADRFAYALLAELRAYENLALPAVPAGRYGPLAWLNRIAMRRDAGDTFRARQIIGGSPRTRTRLLSGGNAQKLLLARELTDTAGVLVTHSPTRGLDVRACQAVHTSLVQRVRDGAACLLISEDLEEVLQLSTHLAVMSRGKLTGPFEAGEVTRERIGELMAGHA